MSAKKKIKITIKQTAKNSVNAEPGESPSFRKAIRQLAGDRRLLGMLFLISIPVGISAQLSWIEFRCVGEPFLGSLKATCRDNLWRMIFGGPLVFSLAFVSIAWIKNQPKPVQRWQLLLPFYLLLPICLLPFIRKESIHDLTIRMASLLFIFGFIFSARQKLWSLIASLYIKPSFSLQVQRDALRLKFILSGEFLPAEREWIFNSVLGRMNEISFTAKEVEIDVRSLASYHPDYDFAFLLIFAFADYNQAEIRLVGLKENTQQIAALYGKKSIKKNRLADA